MDDAFSITYVCAKVVQGISDCALEGEWAPVLLLDWPVLLDCYLLEVRSPHLVSLDHECVEYQGLSNVQCNQTG